MLKYINIFTENSSLFQNPKYSIDMRNFVYTEL